MLLGTLPKTYDNDGALATVTDSATGRKTTYYYDFTDRLMKYTESGGDISHSVSYTYDDLNNLTKMVEVINGTTRNKTYTYDDDNRVQTVSYAQASKTYTYDGFGRVSKRVSKHGSTTVATDTITYRTVNGNATGQVSSLATAAGTYTYTYDGNGNIKTVGFGGNTTAYTYDNANQLLREDNQAGGFTYVWEYDDAGNITSRTEYAYTTADDPGTALDTVTYAYGNSNWGDLLTAYDGVSITHDKIGNPLNDGTWTYTWEHGRELVSMSDGTTTWTYTYDANGMRTKRTNGNATYTYAYVGSQLTELTVDGNRLLLAYDASGSPLAVTYNGTAYYYVTNLQGDVTALLNISGTAVVTYTYDAWGNILTTSGSLASTLGAHNPLRYRGYVYDTETELYYLQSRYYDPQVGRFLSHDVVFDYDAGLQGYDLFAYCGNNPVSRIDVSGADSLQFDAEEENVEDEVPKGGMSAGGNNATVSDVSNKLTQCANNANARVSGRGPVAGTHKHTEFANEVNNLNNPNIQTEVSYLNGEIVTYGTKGSIRFDVVLYDSSGKPIAAWDFKTGSATLSASRIEHMQTRSGLSIDIYVVR